ncbi:MAG TPA: hypothetical protein VME01_06430 [Solirubrobacteraceae bacterium]|nr:hypothetical protein [Solirubrobacteraceae bacterium]
MRGILIAPAGLAAMAVLAGCGSAAVTPTQHVASHSVTVDVSVGGGRQTSTVQV